MAWRPTPEDELIVAQIFLGDCWVEREMKTLRPGDVIRMIQLADGCPVHPTTYQRDPDCVSVVTAYPRKNGEGDQRDYGYGVQVTVYDSLDEVRAAGFA